MTDTANNGFGKFVPGFEFLQNLARQATGGLAQGMQPAAPQLPNLGNWVAPTFNVEELDKRINELKTVQFWLDQNSRALAATIQALEVQKMTLATLRGMNVSMGDVAETLKVKTADVMASMAGLASMGGAPVDRDTDAAPADNESTGQAGKVGGTQFAGLEIPPRNQPTPASVAQPVLQPTPESQAAPAPAPAHAATSAVDPMQWWGALTQQFQTIAAQAMQELPGQTAVEASKHMATALATEAVKTATEMTAGVARSLTAKPDVTQQVKPAKKPATGKPAESSASRRASSAGAQKVSGKTAAPTNAPRQTAATPSKAGATAAARKAVGSAVVKSAAKKSVRAK